MADISHINATERQPVNWGKWLLIGIGVLVSLLLLQVLLLQLKKLLKKKKKKKLKKNPMMTWVSVCSIKEFNGGFTMVFK